MLLQPGLGSRRKLYDSESLFEIKIIYLNTIHIYKKSLKFEIFNAVDRSTLRSAWLDGNRRVLGRIRLSDAVLIGDISFVNCVMKYIK